MKFIAHRGACLEKTEDTLASLLHAAQYGVYAVECDLQYTKDGKMVLFHDKNLKRLANDESCVADLTYGQMKEKLSAAGLELTTAEEVFTGYNGQSAVLFDISFYATDDEFFKRLRDLPFHVIAGVHKPEEAEVARRYLPSEDILGFMPKYTMAKDFHDAGCGVVRLWEQWLKDITPAEVRQAVGETEVWIMSCNDEIKHPLFCMNSSPASIENAIALGADGMLLNDVRLAARYMK